MPAHSALLFTAVMELDGGNGGKRDSHPGLLDSEYGVLALSQRAPLLVGNLISEIVQKISVSGGLTLNIIQPVLLMMNAMNTNMLL